MKFRVAYPTLFRLVLKRHTNMYRVCPSDGAVSRYTQPRNLWGNPSLIRHNLKIMTLMH